jgi:hypothetical protein
LLVLFDPEDGGDMFLRNIRLIPTDHVALYPRRQNSYNAFLRVVSNEGRKTKKLNLLWSFCEQVNPFTVQTEKKERVCTLDLSTFPSLATGGEIPSVENPFGTSTAKDLHS